MKIKIIVFLLLMNSILHAQSPKEKKEIAVNMEASLENDLLNKWYPQKNPSTLFTEDFSRPSLTI